MPDSMVILAGVASSGKSATLHAMADGHEIAGHPHVYSLNGKRVYLNFSSPQEYSDCHFCDFKRVLSIVGLWIRRCDSESCTLLVAPFQIRTSQKDGRINEDCIKKPIDDLEPRFKVYLVYLRKDSVSFISEVDKLMTKCGNKITIDSRNGNERQQAAELLKILITA